MKIITKGMENETDGPDTLDHIRVPGTVLAQELIDRHAIEIISMLFWRTSSKWSIPTRTLRDSMLFIPTSGGISLTVSGKSLPLRPGHIGLLPEGVPHAAGYLAGSDALQVFVLHFRGVDSSGRQTLSRFIQHVQPLINPNRWHARFRELTSILNQDRHAGSAIGRILVLDLLTELILQGCAMHDVVPEMDMRIAETLDYIHSPAADHRIEHLSRRLKISEVHFRKLFKNTLGITPKAYISKLQLDKAMNRLRRTGMSVKTIANECGFCSDHYFHQRFKQSFGITPSECRRRFSTPTI